MAVTSQNVEKKYCYIYYSKSYRNDDGNPRNNKTRIGKCDSVTGKKIYDDDWREKLEAAGAPADVIDAVAKEIEALIKEDPIPEKDLKLLDSVRSYGTYYFYTEMAKKIGLLPVLQQAFPSKWTNLFNIACYMSVCGDAMMYCEDWLKEITRGSTSYMASQRISELMLSITCEERSDFFTGWVECVNEESFIALDITSISSYSQQTQGVEYGYNRDKEKLPQLNVCLLMGEKTRLPLYEVAYSGSLRDVETLTSTLTQFSVLWPNAVPKIVMDKGFYSAKNINDMLITEGETTKWQYDFLIAVPFTSSYAKNLVLQAKKSIETVENTIITPDGGMFGVHAERCWPNIKQKLHTFVYFNSSIRETEKNELYQYVARLKMEAESSPEGKANQEEYARYLIIRKSSVNPNGYTVNIRQDVIEKELEYCGCMVLVSNYLDDPQEAINIYRAKDRVEKGFDRMKNSIALSRLFARTDVRSQNKIFCAFLALIIESAIDKIMDEKHLHKNYTLEKICWVLSGIKTGVYNGHTLLNPLSKAQAKLLKDFSIDPPTVG
ncbi:MAG: transposase [Clostridia bacterium]|nr:transposase [Clostridia bacterium]